MPNYRVLVPAFVLVAGGAFLLGRRATPGTSVAASPAAVAPAAKDSIDYMINQRSLGSPEAPVTVFEMSDFQCPYCRRHALETFPELKQRFIDTGKVQWIFINFPLTQLHPNAAAAAEFGLCSAKADRFWPIHDLLYRNQDTWAPMEDPAPYFMGLADSIGLPRKAIAPCLESGEMRILVQYDAEGASRAGAHSTPSFFIEGGMLRGAVPAEPFGAILDSIYAAKAGG
ncbi:MAG: DsbA family protein [Gemmatimonadales bacterium]